MNKDLLFKYHDDMEKLNRLKSIPYFFFMTLFFTLIITFSLGVGTLSITYLFLSFVLLFSTFYLFVFTVKNEEKVYYYLIHLFKFNFHTTSFPFNSVLNYGDYNVIHNYKPLREWDYESNKGIVYYLKIGSLGKFEVNERSYIKYLHSYHDNDVIILENNELKNLKISQYVTSPDGSVSHQEGL